MALHRGEAHAQEVEFEVGAAPDDLEVVPEGGVRIGMADDDAGRVDALLLEDAQLGQAHRRHDGVGRDREARPPSGPAGRPMDPLLERRQPGLVGADLADDPGPDTRVLDAKLDLPDELLGQVVDRAAVDLRLGRVVGPAVPTGAHDDVEVAGLGIAAQPDRIPAHARQGQVDQGPAAGRPERSQLGHDQGIVRGQLPVVPPIRDLPEVNPGVLVGQDEAKLRGGHRTAHRPRLAGRLGRGSCDAVVDHRRSLKRRPG